MEQIVTLITNQGLAVALVVVGVYGGYKFINRIMDEHKEDKKSFIEALAKLSQEQTDSREEFKESLTSISKENQEFRNEFIHKLEEISHTMEVLQNVEK